MTQSRRSFSSHSTSIYWKIKRLPLTQPGNYLAKKKTASSIIEQIRQRLESIKLVCKMCPSYLQNSTILQNNLFSAISGNIFGLCKNGPIQLVYKERKMFTLWAHFAFRGLLDSKVYSLNLAQPLKMKKFHSDTIV